MTKATARGELRARDSRRTALLSMEIITSITAPVGGLTVLVLATRLSQRRRPDPIDVADQRTIAP